MCVWVVAHRLDLVCVSYRTPRIWLFSRVYLVQQDIVCVLLIVNPEIAESKYNTHRCLCRIRIDVDIGKVRSCKM